jgi:hypothetical protein
MVRHGGSGWGRRLGDLGAQGVCLSNAGDGCCSLVVSWGKGHCAAPVFPSPIGKEGYFELKFCHKIT